jgi:PHD/YefM family antitoxin component YafN of YafNO toxin-antitoxin module
MPGKRASVKMVTIPESELENLKVTIETLENKYVMEQLKKSNEAIKKGKVRNLDEFLKEI